MDALSEGQPISELNPVQKQTQLRSIYAAVPETSALAVEQHGPGHFTFNIPNEGITPEEQSARFPESVDKFMKAATTQKELPTLKFEELKQLLKDAKVTPLLKEKVEYMFRGAFAFGLTKEAEKKDPTGVFTLIGAVPDSSVQEGIFSFDPEVRSAIDKSYLIKIQSWIANNRNNIELSKAQGNDHRIDYFNDKIRTLESELGRGISEYTELYGEAPFPQT